MRPLLQEPAAREAKPSFDKVPRTLLNKIENLLGESILRGETLYGGFSASAGYKIELASGKSIFTKGTHPDEMAHGTQQLRQEIFVYKNCPVLKQVSPKFLGEVSDGDEDGWFLGLWEYIQPTLTNKGDPSATPQDDKIKSLVKLQSEATGMLNSAFEQNYISLFLDQEKKWQRLKSETVTAKKFLTLFENGGEWFEKSIDILCALQKEAFICPEGLLHGDLRVDNFVSGYIVDWPNACRGPLVFDPLFLFANLEALGICSIEKSFETYRCCGGNEFSNDQKTIMAARIAGFFADQAYRAVPEKLPRLRWMQKGILLALLRYMGRLGIIDSCPKMVGENP